MIGDKQVGCAHPFALVNEKITSIDI